MTANWKFIKYLVSIILIGTLFASCVQSDYTKLVKSELAKGIRRDSLLFNIHFGDSKEDFYGKCFDLNKQGLVTEGPGNAWVQYFFRDSIASKKSREIRLLFMPQYDSTTSISEMRMEFSYSGWAPFNRDFQSDSLQGRAKKLLMKWYKGNEFIKTEINNKDIAVKVDGNRRILVHIKDPQSVAVEMQDILNPLFAHSITSKEKRPTDK